VKKRKGLNPVVKFTVIIIFMSVIGFLIFYGIDNPGFFKGKFFSLFGGRENEETASELAGTGENQPGADTDNYTAQDNIDGSETDNSSDGEISAYENPDYSDSAENISFWQKIINFFKGEGDTGEEEQAYPGRLEINFYFSDLGEEKELVPEKRTIIAGNSETAVKNAVYELLKGPVKPYHFPVIPAGTELIGAETYENIAAIDLSQEFLENSLDSRILDEYVIYSIVNTLTEIPEVEGIVFYIEGIRIKVYGNIDLSIPAIRNNDYINEK